MVKHTGWITTSVPADLSDRIENFVNSKEGKKLGFTSKTQFIAHAIRAQLDELGGNSKIQQTKLENKLDIIMEEISKIKTSGTYAPKIEKISIDYDRVILKDNTKNRIAEIVIQKDKLFCQLCDENDCTHVGFALSLPDVYEMIYSKKLAKR